MMSVQFASIAALHQKEKRRVASSSVTTTPAPFQTTLGQLSCSPPDFFEAHALVGPGVVPEIAFNSPIEDVVATHV